MCNPLAMLLYITKHGKNVLPRHGRQKNARTESCNGVHGSSGMYKSASTGILTLFAAAFAPSLDTAWLVSTLTCTTSAAGGSALATDRTW